MSKIDIDELIAFLYEQEVYSLPVGTKSLWLENMDSALKDQGLQYKDGEIIPLEPSVQEPKKSPFNLERLYDVAKPETPKEKASEYSFNIESRLFPTLNAEQQKLWKAEIEQAYKAGSGAITQDQIDALRMEYEKGRADAIANPTGGELLYVLNKGVKQGYKEATDKLYRWLRINHDEIYLRYVRGYNADDEIELLKKYMEEQQ